MNADAALAALSSELDGIFIWMFDPRWCMLASHGPVIHG